ARPRSATALRHQHTDRSNTGRSDPMITLDSVTRRYGEFVAVDHVSFTAHPGRVTGFLGPNGAGKSTTMRVMVGLTPPTSGTATIGGRRFADLPSTRAGPAARSSRSPSG